MTIRSGYVGSGTEQLFVEINEVPSPLGVWLLCSPLMEESVYCRLDFEGLVRSLNERQYTVVQFDYAGYGDSTGDHVDVTLETLSADVDSLVSMCRKLRGGEQLTLFGLRAGGNLSLGAGERHTDVQCIAWFPILEGARYLEDVLNMNLASQYAAYAEIRKNKEALMQEAAQGTPVNVLGYELGYPMLEGIRSLSIDDLPSRHYEKEPVVLLEQDTAGARAESMLEACPVRVSKVSVRRFWQSPRILEPHHRDLVGEMFRQLGAVYAD